MALPIVGALLGAAIRISAQTAVRQAAHQALQHALIAPGQMYAELMAGTSLRLDSSDFMRRSAALDRSQVPFAAMMAINQTAQDVLDDVRARMDVAFDRPTRFTKGAFHIMPRATKDRLEAVVGERPSVTKRHYLKVQEAGGPRGRTGVEELLAHGVALDMDLRSAIPGDNARLDGHGNWSSGERNQVLSALKAQRDPLSNTTERSKRRNKGRTSYFVPRHGGLYPGVYQRDASGNLGITLIFSPRVATYTPRLNFLDGAEDIARKKMGVNFAEALKRALASAR